MARIDHELSLHSLKSKKIKKNIKSVSIFKEVREIVRQEREV